MPTCVTSLPVNTGEPGGKYTIVLPVSNPSAPSVLMYRRAVRGGEIIWYDNCFVLYLSYLCICWSIVANTP